MTAHAQDRSPAVAGSFYPDDPKELRELISRMLSESPAEKAPGEIQGILVPHAGYQYSGPVAARAYRLLQLKLPQRVVVLAFSHSARFDGASIYTSGHYQTPLGRILTDEPLAQELMSRNRRVRFFREAEREAEHSLEVQLPFIQVALGPSVKILPLTMGRHDTAFAKELARDLVALAKAHDLFFVITTDWSHYHPRTTAQEMDQQALRLLEKLDADGIATAVQSDQIEMCGIGPVLTACYLMRELGATEVRVLHYGDSADVTGDTSGVVGYAAVTFARPASQTHRSALLSYARQVLETHVRHQALPDWKRMGSPWNEQTGGVFVTLRTHGGDLRGCIGRTESDEPIAKTTQEMTASSATEDPRFTPVQPDELTDLRLEVSILSVPKRMN